MMTKNLNWKQSIAEAFNKKAVWKRLVITIVILIFGAFLVMVDQQCDYNKKTGQLSCGTKSNLEMKK